MAQPVIVQKSSNGPAMIAAVWQPWNAPGSKPTIVNQQPAASSAQQGASQGGAAGGTTGSGSSTSGSSSSSGQ